MYTFISMWWKHFSLLLCNIYKKTQVNEQIKTSYKILPFTQQHNYSDELLMCLRTHDRKKECESLWRTGSFWWPIWTRSHLFSLRQGNYDIMMALGCLFQQIKWTPACVFIINTLNINNQEDKNRARNNELHQKMRWWWCEIFSRCHRYSLQRHVF